MSRQTAPDPAAVGGPGGPGGDDPAHIGAATGPLDICIVAHFAYGALAGGNAGHIGGVERQTALLARWLAGRGHRVSLVTWDEGQPDGAEIRGVRVLALCRRDAGWPIVRFFHPRWTSLCHALRRANAAVYYQNCGEYVTGQVALWCRWHGRGFVYSVASDADCDGRLPFMSTVRERVLYRLGVRYADRVIVQTRTQHDLLRQGFSRDAVVIPMPCLLPPDSAPSESELSPPAQRPVLWIGRICEVKRPDRLLDLAAACRELHFDLVGPSDASAYSRRVLDRAAAMPNVTVQGPATHDQVPSFYRRASCLCLTSDAEGFPNTFLEAWGHGLPVVSTIDPDGLIARHGLGGTARDVAGLAGEIRSLLGSPHVWSAVSARARTYYRANHTVDHVMPRFERVLREGANVRAVASSGVLPAASFRDGV